MLPAFINIIPSLTEIKTFSEYMRDINYKNASSSRGYRVYKSQIGAECKKEQNFQVILKFV